MFSLSMVKPSKDQKGKAVLNAFIEIVNESDCKINFYEERRFYNKLIQKWLDNIAVIINSTHNEGNSVITKRFIKTLKTKIYKKWHLMIANLIFLIWINW